MTAAPPVKVRTPCQTGDPERYFVGCQTTNSQRPVDTQQLRRLAAELCAGCPVTDWCLDRALDLRAVGVWGGTTDAMRDAMRRRNQPSRGPVCGSMDAVMTHLRAGEPLDRACRAARDTYAAQQYAAHTKENR